MFERGLSQLPDARPFDNTRLRALLTARRLTVTNIFSPAIAVALPDGPLPGWRFNMLRALQQEAPNLVLLTGLPQQFDLTRPWRALFAAQQALARSGADPLKPVDRQAALADFSRLPLSQADPSAFALLVCLPGADLPPGFAQALPWGAFTIETPDTSDFFPGSVQGRLLWTRPGASARVAQSTVTCLRGPFVASFVREHFAKAALFPARAIRRLAQEGEAYWQACPEDAAWHSGLCRPAGPCQGLKANTGHPPGCGVTARPD